MPDLHLPQVSIGGELPSADLSVSGGAGLGGGLEGGVGGEVDGQVSMEAPSADIAMDIEPPSGEVSAGAGIGGGFGIGLPSVDIIAPIVDVQMPSVGVSGGADLS